MSLIVDQKYAGLVSYRLRNFKKKDRALFNFSCPYCGDSSKSKHKARGFLYEAKDALAYKCHNCGMSCMFGKFLEFVDSSLHSEYAIESYTGRRQPKIGETVKKKVVLEKTELDDWGLDRLSALPVAHTAVVYCAKRRVPKDRYKDLYYCKDMRLLEEYVPGYEGRMYKEARVIIPFRNLRGELTGLTGRDLGDSKVRYMTMRIASDEPLIFGLDRCDRDEQMYTTEGQFDSMMLTNAIAAGGSEFQRAAMMFPESTLIFDNQPRNREVVGAMQGLANQNYKLVIWPSTWEYKDINEGIMDGLTRSEAQAIIDANTFRGLSLQLALKEWKKC